LRKGNLIISVPIIVLLILLPVSLVAEASNSGSAAPPYKDMTYNEPNNNYCEFYYYDLQWPAGYTCTEGSTTSGLSATGEYADPTGPDTFSSFDEYVYFDQYYGNGVALSNGGTVSMATYGTFHGYVGGTWACASGTCSGDAGVEVVWTYTMSSGQVQYFFRTDFSIDQNGQSAAVNCSNCQFGLVATNVPASVSVGGGIYTYAWSDSGYNTWAWFTPQDPLSYFGTSYYAYTPQILGASWSVTLSASNLSPSVGTPVTLTAATSANVAPWYYYINIFDQTTGTLLTSCSSGTSCSTTVSQSVPTTHTYMACVSWQGTCAGPPYAPGLKSNLISVTWGSGTGLLQLGWGHNSPPTASFTLTFGQSVTQGDLLVAMVGTYTTGLAYNTPADTQHNPWQSAVVETSNDRVQVFYTIAGSTGSDSITLSASSDPNSDYIYGFIAEFSHAAGTFDKSSTGYGTGNPQVSSFTPSSGTVVVAIAAGPSSWSLPSGSPFHMIGGNTAWLVGAAYAVSWGSGSTIAQWANSGTYGEAAASFH
jgi:hypothetical protein